MSEQQRLSQQLAAERARIEAGGGAEKLQAMRERGLLTARERLALLFAAGSFQESGAHVRHDARFFGMADRELPADGVITGSGYVDGRHVAAFSQDSSVCAGTLGRAHAQKIVQLQNYALKTGVPLLAMQDSGGARIQEGVDALSGYGRVFYHNVLLSGVVPQVALVLGPCAGGAAYSPALMDFIIMTRDNAYMFITGPEIIKAVTGRAYSKEELGGAQMHASLSGNVHFIADNDSHAIALARQLLSYLPANNTEDPPHVLDEDLDLAATPALAQILPDDSSEPYDMQQIIRALVDADSLLEIQAGFAPNIIIALARICGMVIGLVANQPLQQAGALDINAADKAARFIRFCNTFNIPLLTLVDVPGFLPGIEQERGGIIRHGAKMLHAYASCTSPKITVVLRKAFGGSYLAMCSQEMGADLTLAWPSAEIAVMGAEGAVSLLYRKELGSATDRQARLNELAADYRSEFASPYLSAARGYLNDIIAPDETRAQVALGLRKLLSKRELRPAKKHGNIPL